ncbi:uncharacterized protein LOC110449316 [Mizuhopecten yessoensis]|uniref:uncharacterized protein LOC110449316 n=1 Tax=Mizuhopecten yessoensis TaxID=6573 RepID=UPI000B457574|nr:uncharacterized protein LOC110449316 [Mizuhopecten yessoensis]
MIGNTAKQSETEQKRCSFDEAVNHQVKDLHGDMIVELAGYFTPSCKKNWDDLCVLMRKHLDYASVYGNGVTHVGILFETLMAKGIVSYGCYDKVIGDIKQIHVDAAKIVKDTTDCIRSITKGQPWTRKEFQRKSEDDEQEKATLRAGREEDKQQIATLRAELEESERQKGM